MNSIWKRSLAMLLSLVMVFGMLPMSAFAEEGGDTHTHSYTSEVTTPATCEDDGVMTITYTCDCGLEPTTEVIEATGHAWGEGVETTAATCTQMGVKTYTCGNCNETKTEDVAANGHNYVDGKCDVCGSVCDHVYDETTGVCTVCNYAPVMMLGDELEQNSESDTLKIGTAAELFAFANDVNVNKNEYSGKTVILTTNINLVNAEWTPIGANADAAPKFRGTFDGQGYTISNLVIDQKAGYHAAGLFGATEGTIKNLTIDRAWVNSTSSGNAYGDTDNGTAVVAGSTAYGATIENVHVKNATVYGNRYVAGIVGYMDGTVIGCSVEDLYVTATPDDLTGSYDNGDKVGGIVGYCNSGAVEISGCELKGIVSLTAYRDVAGIVGCASTGVKVNSNTNSAALTVTVDQITNSYGEKAANAGEFIGRDAPADATGNITAEGATYTPVVAEEKPEISGTFEGGMVNVEDSAKTFITADVKNLYATESVVLKLFDAKDTLLATTTLLKPEYYVRDSLSVKFCILGTSSSWSTVWEEGKLSAEYVPSYATLYVDGQEMNSANIQMITTNGETPIDWADVPGVPAAEEGVVKIGDTSYASLEEALAAAKAAGMTEVEITVLKDIDFSTAVNDFTKVTFTGTNREQTIDMNVNAVVDVKTKLVFNNLTVSRLDAAWLNHWTYIHGGLTYNNCKMIGLFIVTAQDTDFIDCDFYNDDTFGDGNYSLWLYNCYDGVEVNVTDCTFNVYERAIKMYGDGYKEAMTLNISGTEFTSRTADKTVVEMAYANGTGTGVMNLNITDSTATGFGAPEDIEGETNAWFNVEGNNSNSVVKLDSVQVWPVEEGLKGSGTETDPYLINNLEDLKWFRDSVNTYTSDRSNQYVGKYVKLTADIDLAGENWTPIGTNSVGDHMAFMGTFYGEKADGTVPTISNLYIDADGDHLGFFARTGSYNEAEKAVIKNLKFNKVDVSSNGTNHWAAGHGDYVGGVIANCGGNTYVENITVTGDVYVEGCGYVGGIVGHGYPKMSACSVAAEEGSYVHAYYWCAGGLIGYAGEGTSVTNCSVSGLGVWGAYGAAAAAVGLANDKDGQICKLTNVSASNVEVTGADYLSGYVAGNGNTAIMTNVTATNVTLGEDIVATDAVATVGNVAYFDLQSALNAAAEGTGNVTVEILRDIDLTNVDWNPVTVSGPGYPLVTVNGNKKTITGLNDMLFGSTWAGNSGLIIKDLTIKDSTIVNDENDDVGTVGVGAFIGYPQASATITLDNCHLVDSTVKGGHWTGGLIGMAGGYNGNDGPVFMNLTIKDCSVTGSTITGKGSAGGVIGHGSCAAWTNVVIEDTTVSGNTITSTGSSSNKAGSVMGTIGAAGQPTTANGETKTGGAFVEATVSGNTVTSAGTTISTIYGRQGTETGVLTLTGGSYDSYPIEQNVSYAAPKKGFEITGTNGTYSLTEKAEEAPELPSATVTELDKEDLTFAMTFEAAEAEPEQVTYYGNWYADFVLTVNKDVTFNADSETSDGWLSGQFDAYGSTWLNVPFDDVTLKAGESLRIMKYAADEFENEDLRLTYNAVYNQVKKFNCGVYFTDEFLAANPDLEVTLELRLYEDLNDTTGKVIGETYEFTNAPELPNAIVKKIKNEDLTFAMNFKADQATDQQLAYYGNWYADFVLTVNKDVTFNADSETSDGWLSGQYDNWNFGGMDSSQWINVPVEDVKLKADESLKIMEYAAKMMQKPDLKQTYSDVYNVVKDFDCGVYFTPKFLAANPDLEVTLELRLYKDLNDTTGTVIGDTYTFTIPALPTATVTDITNEDLTFAKNFKADPATEEQLAYYGNWYADFELTVDRDVTFNADSETSDGWLSGQYDNWSFGGMDSSQWINVPVEDVKLKADESLKIMEYAAKMMQKPDLKQTYSDVHDTVKDFDCGVYFTDLFIVKNPGAKVTLELKMYNPDDETISYTIGQPYVFTIPDSKYVAWNMQTGEMYETVFMAAIEAESGEVVQLLKDVSGERVVIVNADTDLDLNGFTLDVNTITSFGNVVDNSGTYEGELKGTDILLQSTNAQLPIMNGDGYHFYKVTAFNHGDTFNPGAPHFKPSAEGNVKYGFQPKFEPIAHELIMAGEAASHLSFVVRVDWKNSDGEKRDTRFYFNDAKVQKVTGNYDPVKNKYTYMYTLELIDYAKYENLTYKGYVVSDTGAEFCVGAINIGGGNAIAPTNPITPPTTTLTSQEVKVSLNNATATVAKGTKLDGTATEATLTLMISDISESDSEADVTLAEGETLKSVDVHVDGIASDNTTPVTVTLPAFLEPGLNMGNVRLYHVENGETVEMTFVESVEDFTAHNQYWYDPATGDVVLYMATFSQIAVVSEAAKWEGNVAEDFSGGTGTEFDPFIIANADQLAYFGEWVGAGNDYEGQYVKLISDIDLNDAEGSSNDYIFHPIGYYYTEDENGDGTTGDVYSTVRSFEGTFDGNNRKISNFYQNTWEIKGDYNEGYPAGSNYYKDGMGLFGYVVNGTVKNLTVHNFKSDGEFTPTGVIAAYAVNSTFENIAITDCNPRVYNTGNGGIVGIGGNSDDPESYRLTFNNITIDNSNIISALWGSWDVACGGLVGMFRGAGHVYMNNCHVAAQMDVNNDVCGNYQYYWYRYSGMLVGTNKNMTTDVNGYTVPETSKFHAENCTVHFGDWNDYYYCELVVNSKASYTHDHQFSRLERVEGDLPESATGTKHYYKDNGDGTITCRHFINGVLHNHKDSGYEDGIDENNDGYDDLKEDKTCVYLPFNQLFTGYGWGVKHIPIYNDNTQNVFPGVTILDTPVADSIMKFEKADNAQESYMNGTEYAIGDLFKAANITAPNLGIKGDKVQVTVSPVLGEGETVTENSVTGTFVADIEDWTKGTLTFTGIGKATITITDYYFCTPTSFEVEITKKEAVEKFASKIDRNYSFLYRVGNLDKFPVGVLFEAIEGAEIDTANVEVTVTSETAGITGTYTANASDWTKSTLKIDGAGLVTVSITDNDSCKPTSVTVEVIAAKNAYSGTVPDAAGTNVVLLEDVSDSGFTVSGKHFYGNGFTVTCAGNGAYGNTSSGSRSLYVGYVTVEKGGTLDNVKVICNTFPESYMFTSELEAVGSTYPYSRPAVTVSEDSTISGCYIYGARVNILVRGGNVTIQDTITDSGALANIHIISQSDYTVTLDDVTTIQSLKNADFDATKKVLGFAVAVGTTDSTSNPTIKLTGDLRQYNWVTRADADNATGTYSSGIIEGALGVKRYQHTIIDETAVNLGIAYVMKGFDINIEDERSNKAEIPYELNEVTMKILGNNLTGKVYSIVNSETAANRNNADADNVVDGQVSTNSTYIPQFAIAEKLGGQEIEAYDGCDEYCYEEEGTVKVMFPSGDTKKLDLDALVKIEKYTGQELPKTITVKDENNKELTVTDDKVSLSEAGEYTVTYTVTDKIIYGQDGAILNGDSSGIMVVNEEKGTIDYYYYLPLSVTLKDVSVPDAYFQFDSSKQVIYAQSTAWFGSGDYKQFMPFLAGLKIYDYNGQTPYLRFDGDEKGDNGYKKIAKATIANNNTKAEGEGYHIITVELTDGGKLVIDLDVRAISGGSTHEGFIKVSNNVLYVVNGGTTGAKGQLWKVYDYEFTGNNGVVINSGAVTFGTSGTDAATNTAPSTNFGTTINYTMTYDANGGNCGQIVGYATSASAAVTLPTPTRSGYLFTGWYTAASGGDRVGGAGENYTPNANVTLYAQWGKPSTVTYDANGGSVTPASEKYTGTALTLPTPTRDGYWFTGWFDAAEGGTKVGNAGASYQATGDVTLYAQWSPVYTVTYNANGGSGAPTSAKYEGTALVLPAPTKTGFTFSGWSDGNTTYAAGTSYTPDKNITLTAQWKTSITVTYNSNGGNAFDPVTIGEDESLTLPTPTRTGYTLTGWSDGTQTYAAGASYTPTGNITLTAQWTQNSYTITISKQDNATVTVDKATAHYNDTVSVTVSFSKNSSKTLTVKDESGNTVLSKSAANTYTFTMPASNVTIEASSSDGCVTPDTLVTLADGSQKRIDEVTYEDQLLVWNFNTGAYDVVPAAIIFNHGTGSYRVLHLGFENGKEVKVIYNHGFFDANAKNFVFIDENNVDSYLGHEFLMQTGDSYETVKLVDYYVEEEYTTAYALFSAFHLNCILEGMFTITPAVVENNFYMPYEIGEDMKYDEVKKQADIEKYGLYTYADFAHVLTEEQFNVLNIELFKVSVGKGLVTYEKIVELIKTYI